MAKRGPKNWAPEKIVALLRQVEAAQAQDMPLKDALREHDISLQTFYRWRRTYGNMAPDEAKRLKELEKENARLKKLVADLSLDKDILREALGKKL